jgi:alpha-galactosidase
LGRMATLVERTPATDLLLKPLKGGDYAVAVLNRSDAPIQVKVEPAELGLSANPGCRFNAENLWTGESNVSLPDLETSVDSHETAIWRIKLRAVCGAPTRTGAIVMTTDKPQGSIDGYAHCLADSGVAEDCSGSAAEAWTITARGELKSGDGCMAAAGGEPALKTCDGSQQQRWRYTLAGNLVNASDSLCLSNQSAGATGQPITLQACGHNQLNQIWSLPN